MKYPQSKEGKMELLPLVLIHGYPLDHKMWYGVIAALGGGVRVIGPDLRGFGRADSPEGEPRIETMAEDVLGLLKRERVERAVVAGMSMGGYVALAMAELAPDKLAGLALVNSQVYADTDEQRAGRREMIKKVRSEGPVAAAQAINPKFFSANRKENPEYLRFAIEGAERAGVEGITWALEAMARRPDRSAVLAEPKLPILILHSADDRIIPLEKARQMAALNRALHFAVVKNAGHAAAIEAPDEVAAALRRFLEICSEPASEAKG
jgi:pimeloyl-ACP methyl ester carboxylesterase